MLGKVPLWSLVLWLLACGGDDDDDDDHDPDAPSCGEARASIGAAGGSVSSADGKLTLNIPAGALTADTLVHIGPRVPSSLPAVFADPPAALAWCVGPPGLTFAVPVEVQLTLTTSELPVASNGSMSVMAIGVTNEAGDAVQLSGVGAVPEDLGDDQWRVSGSLSHFGSVAWLEGFRLQAEPQCTTCGVDEVYEFRVSLLRSRPTVQAEYARVGVGAEGVVVLAPSDNGAAAALGVELHPGGVLDEDVELFSAFRCATGGTGALAVWVSAPGATPGAVQGEGVRFPITCAGPPSIARRARPDGMSWAPHGFAGRSRRATDPEWFTVTYNNGFTIYDPALSVIFDVDISLGVNNPWSGVALLYEDGGDGTMRSGYLAAAEFGGVRAVTAGSVFQFTVTGGAYADVLAFEAPGGGTDGMIVVDANGSVQHRRIQENEINPGEYLISPVKSSDVLGDGTLSTVARSAVGPDPDSPVLVVTQGAPGKLFHVDWNATAVPHPKTEIADVGDDPRQVRCTPDFTTCAVSAYGSNQITVVSWPNALNPPSLVGRVNVGDGPVGLDLISDGADVLVASTGYNDDTLHVTRLAGGVLTDTATSLAGRCAQPRQARFTADGLGVLVSCNGSDRVVTEPLP